MLSSVLIEILKEILTAWREGGPRNTAPRHVAPPALDRDCAVNFRWGDEVTMLKAMEGRREL
jgi:hypothetical protein